jgi:hypothetical protein
MIVCQVAYMKFLSTILSLSDSGSLQIKMLDMSPILSKFQQQ